MMAGSGLLVAVFCLRTIRWGAIPLTSPVEFMNLFLLMSTAVIGLVLRDQRMRPLQCYFAPTLAIVAFLVAMMSRKWYYDRPSEFNEAFLTIHVGLACLAYALFFIASLTSVAYFVQVWRLKQNRPSGLFHRMPSLELLDSHLYRLIVWGYPLFLITAVLGTVWAVTGGKDQITERWWQSPKVVHSIVTAIFFGLSVHLRQFGLLRGRKLAYFVFYGFTVILISIVALRLFNISGYNFWNAAE
jgi:ABC-type transport system involved in cytochrome c biogenesis permease subunit